MMLAFVLENELEFIRFKTGRESSKQKEQCEQGYGLVNLGSLAWMGSRLRRKPGLNEKAKDEDENQIIEDPVSHAKYLDFILQEHW